MTDNEELEFEETGLPCPCGISSDAFARNRDGSGKCFRGDCSGGPKKNGFFPSGKLKEKEEVVMETSLDIIENEEVGYFRHRGISSKTFEFFGVKSGIVDGEIIRTAFKYPSGRSKVRDWRIPKKERRHFQWTKATGTKEYLFGKDKFDPGSKEAITITEGEYDALAIHEVLGNRTASVSVRSSSSARLDVAAERDYINSFKKIYICFDSDSAGEKAAKEISNIFDFQKVYYVNLTKYKDANEYLERDEADALIQTWTNAKRYSPDSVIHAKSDIRKALEQRASEAVVEWPFRDLQASLRGLHKKEMILMKGPTGIGKTEICRAVIHKTLKDTSKKAATIFLEEDAGTTIRGVATYEANQPFMDMEAGYSDDDIMEAYDSAIGGDDDRLYIHSHFTSDDDTEIVDNIRFLVTVAGCEIVILDNLTVLASGRPGDDERQRIDGIVAKLRNLVNELEFCLVLLAHTNDDGTTRGSRFPDIIANTVILLDREKGHNELTLFVSKARTQGAKEGSCGFAIYDPMKWVLRDPTEKEKFEFETRTA